jgi:hypothetical protein
VINDVGVVILWLVLVFWMVLISFRLRQVLDKLR